MSVRTKVKNALDEARILVLGVQVLLGFQYRAFFEPGFDRLPRFNQHLKFAGLVLLLAVIGLIMLLFSLLFGGFSVLFSQIREALRDQWTRAYPKPYPPMAPVAEPIYTERVDGS